MTKKKKTEPRPGGSLSNFLETKEFSLKDSPMFQELIENIKNNRTYSANNKFDYNLKLSKSPKKYRDEIHFNSQIDEQNVSLNLYSIVKLNTMSKHIVENKKSTFSYLPINFNSENSFTNKENSEVAA